MEGDQTYLPEHIKHKLADSSSSQATLPRLWHKHSLCVNSYAPFGFDFYVGPLLCSFREGPTFRAGSIRCLQHMLPICSLFLAFVVPTRCPSNNIFFLASPTSTSISHRVKLLFLSLFLWIHHLSQHVVSIDHYYSGMFHWLYGGWLGFITGNHHGVCICTVINQNIFVHIHLLHL